MMETGIIQVLLIEDNPGDTRLVQEMLVDLSLMNYFEGYTFNLMSTGRLNSALSILDKETFDIVLVDLSLPDSQGLDTVKAVCKVAPSLPIIVLSGQTETTTATRAVQEGAQDYLLKGSIDGQLLARSIRYAIERKKKDLQLQQLASFDPLTNLVNRALFSQYFTKALAMAKRHEWIMAVLFIDLDNFKPINDNFSHKMGDLVLQMVASRLTSNLQVNDTVARMGGDEFVIILNKIKTPLSAGKVAQRLLDALRAPMHINEKELYVSGSIGISLYPNNAEDEASLLKNADMAMYWAKNDGGDSYKFHTIEMTHELQDKLKLENELCDAVQNEKFNVLYQPQIDLKTGNVCGVEVSLHLFLSNGSQVDVNKIIVGIRELGLLAPVGLWVFNEVLQHSSFWEKNKIELLIKNNFLNLASSTVVMKALHKTKMSHFLEIELEMAEKEKIADLMHLVELIKPLGIQVAIDNLFNPAALECTRVFQINTIKLDPSLVQTANNNGKDAAIVKGMIDVAHAMDISVAAQGVETKEQLDFLRSNNCDKAQGDFICPPVNIKELQAKIRKLNKSKI